ncbi:hypothetical protein [Segetibacter aerophilus]|uniref:Nucleotide-diphospho-sugar transferase domain-containing protein n=1 Tax=Segetibacter aerophilus TaxID=670293 RepID=A0A512BBC4_9BACT|nr:hypothetical protein [Segetibacter aerophilus]GEO09127.1 hypothetical protein SAE01_16230 [Segetibacter aerophilus]
MAFIACTLFEKQHHYGVAALVNSLYNNNYRGAVYVGYKGELPPWCSDRKKNTELSWEDASTLKVAEDLKIHFLPIKSTYHLAFYKPTFLIELFNGIASHANAIAYFDPDIVIKCKWIAFETWMTHGVSLVQENPSFPATHPLRGEWKKVIDKINFRTTRDVTGYFNSGFCGVNKENIEFLTIWARVIEIAKDHFNLKPTKGFQTKDRTYLFYNADQDALNTAAMCCVSPLSEVGPEGMDFVPGGFIMSHAIGRVKPWNKKFIYSAFKAIGPTQADRGYWQNSNSPIRLYSDSYIKRKFFKISMAALISRFYRRS